MEKQQAIVFVFCLVDDVKHHENDVERHEVSCVYQIKLPTLGFSALVG